MSFVDGVFMFLFSMVCFATLVMVAWFIIEQVLDDRKRKQKVDLEKDRKSLE